MKNYIVYNADGKILKTGICPDNMIDAQAGDHYSMEGVADDATQKIAGGTVVDKIKSNSELNESALIDLRQHRDSLLSQTDWTQIPDAPISDSEKERYKIYRQKLRDMPQEYCDIISINEVIFPEVNDV